MRDGIVHSEGRRTKTFTLVTSDPQPHEVHVRE